MHITQLNVFTNLSFYKLRSKLTHGLVQKVLRSGRVADSWIGAAKEVAKRVSSTTVQGGVIDRNGMPTFFF